MITVNSESTHWIFDLDAKRYLRIPLDENVCEHPLGGLAYEQEWVEFTDIYSEAPGIWFVRRASDGHRIMFFPVDDSALLGEELLC